MTCTFSPATDRSITLEEYFDHVRTHVDARDLESVAASAAKLKELANNRTFVAEILNRQLATAGANGLAFYSTQSAVLMSSDDLAVRVNLWPPAGNDPRRQKADDQVYSYHAVHDHNFSFMTVGYHGPGYVTRLYECDPGKITGYIGERVDLRFAEETSLPEGKVMLYRAYSDIHMQMPPPSFSMSLNLMIGNRYNGVTQQHYYDVERGVISDYVESISSKRVSVVECLRFIGNENSKDLLERLSHLHPCVRTRWAAYETLAALEPQRAAAHWCAAQRDRDPLLKHAATTRLRASNR
jgi:hypothetical protein